MNEDKYDTNGIGARLKHERAIRKVSKAQAAKEIGINVVTLSRIEMGYGCHYGTALFIIKWIERL